MAIKVPAGVKIGAGRETSQSNSQGTVVQGMVFPFTTAVGSVGSFFVPYSEIGEEAKVQTIVDDRVASVEAISG